LWNQLVKHISLFGDTGRDQMPALNKTPYGQRFHHFKPLHCTCVRAQVKNN
jgi:hypothetical protein